MAKRVSKKRAASMAGQWPVADAVPFVIDLLRRVSYWENSSVMTEDARRQARSEIIAILERWEQTEDIEELRQFLGLKQKKRRTQLQVNTEYAISFAYSEQVERGTRDPIGTVAEEFHTEPRTVQRAFASWGHLTSKIVKSARENRQCVSIDYEALKPPKRNDKKS